MLTLIDTTKGSARGLEESLVVGVRAGLKVSNDFHLAATLSVNFSLGVSSVVVGCWLFRQRLFGRKKYIYNFMVTMKVVEADSLPPHQKRLHFIRTEKQKVHSLLQLLFLS